ncbi:MULTISPECIES: hypothetical protein [unclassified Streptomyces]|uniref:hypothetical protein n=1 Tax=unclassified Streptomyces TaxID=2593676 RepID=UPI0036330EA0
MRIPHAAWSDAITQLDAGAFVDVLVLVTEVKARATAARRSRASRLAAVATAAMASARVQVKCSVVPVSSCGAPLKSPKAL